MHNIKYEIVSEDGLRKETYQYYPLVQIGGDDQSIRLVLDSYIGETRATTRHKWQAVSQWGHVGRNRYDSFKREEVPIREDVRQAVLRQFIESITIE